MSTENNAYELSVTRHINGPPELVWQLMTERLAEWWCPKPWRVEIIEQQWHAGGRTAVVMHGPEGEKFPVEGIFLEVTPGRRFVFTDAVNSQWQPQQAFMIGLFEIAPQEGGTRYTASARHWSEEARQQHLEMGFEEGWSAVAEQLAQLAEQEATP